ncbi:IclR family transcriptional regulator [Lacisediminihabitans profunda]|uniref:IclR family transcriptional regulator n=1 Tax=Lacisediminihabitans profunda TaxID=2594790 RepID=A0A5C8UNP6_9MICO|nr:IclR family transcriptional regulator [Lacisediminihabitans profunda]TXN29996.1 IclR family transcriptional regulator [Lacisediminihabitans profunda]
MTRPTVRDSSSLAKGLSLLDMFRDGDDALTMRELARRSGLPTSTTHRLVIDLTDSGLLTRGGAGYQLGVKLFELGSLVPRERKLRDIALPFAHNLNEVTQLTANVAVRDGTEIVYIEKVTTRSLTVPHSRAGGRLPLYCTGLGKAILAFSDSVVIEAVLSAELLPLAPRTIVSPVALRRQLEKIREEKVAYDLEESQPALFCVASPIFDRAHHVVAAISVTGATDAREARHLAPTVRATAMALSRELSV